jgi:aminomethyltransferase
MNTEEPKSTYLHDFHLKLGAKMVNFGGYEMPLAYSAGTVKEHLECRSGAVVFDVSHLGTVLKTGNSAFEELQTAFTNDLNKISTNKCQYTHLLNDEGFVVDDIIIWWVKEEMFLVMPNASNTSNVLEAIGGDDITSNRCVLALQGPKSRELISKLSFDIAQTKFNTVYEFDYKNTKAYVAGTGYTGEDGIEVHVDNQVAEEFFATVLDLGFSPAGLGARDTLRLEAGLPLYGHEISLTRSTLEANLGWVVAFNKPYFIGKEQLLNLKSAGKKQTLVGLKSSIRKPIRQFDLVYSDGNLIGEVVSGNYSPILNVGIGTAYINVDQALTVGDSVTVVSRNSETESIITKLPFVPHNRKSQ